MAESGSTIPLVNVTTSGGYGAAIPAFTVSTSAGAFAGIPIVSVTTSEGYGAAIPTVGVTTSAGAFSGVPTVDVTTSGGAFAGIVTVQVTTSGGEGAATKPIVSASSGLVQISGVPPVIVSSSGGLATITVVSASSGFVQVSTATIPTVSVTTSGGVWATVPAVTVTTSGGVWATVPLVTVTTSGGWGSAQSITSTGVRLTEGAGITPKFQQATSVSKVSSSAGNLWSIYAFTTGINGAVLRLYNASTSNVSMGASVAAYVDVDYQSSALASVATFQQYAPWGMNFGTACSYDVVLNATSTLTVAGQAFVTSLFR